MRLFQPDCLKPPRNFQPLNWQTLADKNLCLEIGAGKGMHAMQYVSLHPNHYLIAIERTLEKYTALAKHNNLPNLKSIHADAIAWSVFGLAPFSLNKIFILYPNPEPKNPAQRWLNMPFFQFLLSRLKTHGQIQIASNIDSYINEAEQQLINNWKLPFNRFVIDSKSARTHFEIKYLAKNQQCQQLNMTKPVNYQTPFDQYDKTSTSY